MVNLDVYPSRDLPPLIKCQILSFMRMHWTGGYTRGRQFRDEVSPDGEEENTLHLVLEERGFVIAHAGVVWKTVEHQGVSYRTGGLTGVFTFPNFRGKGHGASVVQAATEYMKEHRADIGLSTCHPDLRPFYQGVGWTPMDGATLVYGNPAQPQGVDELVIIASLSDQGRSAGKQFEQQRIYVGAHPW